MDKFIRIRLRIPAIVKLCSTITTVLVTFLIGSFLLFETDSFAQEDIVARTYQVNHASVRRLEPIIRPLLMSGGSLAVDERTNCLIVRDTQSSINNIGDALSVLDTEMPSHTFLLNYADPVAIAAKISRIVDTQVGIVEPDSRTHTVFVMTTVSNLERIKSLVSGWDAPSAQVLIEADILDVSTAKLKELGIDWELRLTYDGGDNDAIFNVNTRRAPTKSLQLARFPSGRPR